MRLDIGCNTGHFSILAGRRGARVVAIDRDPDAVDMLFDRAAREQLEVLPLVIDVARPPGACGWNNGECSAFLDRARGQFDCVLLLAMLHHLLVNDRVPLRSVLDFLAAMTTRLAIVEFVDRADRQFQRLTQGREELHRDLSREQFEAAARATFEILRSAELTPTRWIYLLRHGRA